LDGIDYGRFLRAVEAERMEAVERRRALYLEGKLEELSAAEWEIVKAHDAMAEEDVNDGE
jgi:hypothetical protein